MTFTVDGDDLDRHAVKVTRPAGLLSIVDEVDVEVWAGLDPAALTLVGTLRTGPPDGNAATLVIPSDLAPPAVDVEAVLAAWRDLCAAVQAVYEQIGRALVPWLDAMRDDLNDLADRHPELLDAAGPAAPADRALWAKQRPGRTGPPPRRLDGRRRR